jgi:putative transcriptional regulator
MKDPGQEDLRKEFKVYNRVKVLRQELDLSRQELADALNIGYRTLGYIERQDYTPSLELAWRISRFFDLPLDAVFSPEEPFGRMSKELYGSPGERRQKEG